MKAWARRLVTCVNEEFGERKGLGIIPGRVTTIPNTGVDDILHKMSDMGSDWLEWLHLHESEVW